MNNPFAESAKRLFPSRINAQQVKNLVSSGFITADEYAEITGEAYSA